MPKYEYACKSCGEHLEVVQSFADAPLTECPACGGPLRKVYGAPAITFKGSGFYRTDNRKRRPSDAKSDASTADGKADATSGSSSGSGDSGGSGDSKSEPAKKDPIPSADSKAKPQPKATEAKTA